ncbi:MAG: YegS/Rv2252/BmrU family lipid kinase [Bacillota bacterium]|nr:YegS/Rv2252/BmrU family lipid kinase [Bacillota bacterium]
MDTAFINRKLYFLMNPKAGLGKMSEQWKDICQKLNSLGVDYFWEFSQSGEDSSQQVRRAVLNQGAQVVVSLGGDGSLHDVVNGLIEKDQLLRPDIVLATYPAGSACDFSRLVYRNSRVDLVQLLQHGQVRDIDLGRCRYSGPDARPRTSYFINGFDAGAGADTCIAVNEKEGRLKKLFGGKLAFLLTALGVLTKFSYTRSQIRFDGEQEEGEYLLMALGNGQYMGGSMKFFPSSRLDDGKLDLLLARKRNFLSILPLFVRLYQGKLEGIRGCLFRQVEQVQISCERPIPFELDGEVPGFTDVELSILPASLPFLFPRECYA